MINIYNDMNGLSINIDLSKKNEFINFFPLNLEIK